jgi:hypothetical protein
MVWLENILGINQIISSKMIILKIQMMKIMMTALIVKWEYKILYEINALYEIYLEIYWFSHFYMLWLLNKSMLYLTWFFEFKWILIFKSNIKIDKLMIVIRLS